MNKLLKVNCPQCDISFSYYESEFRPFCCERCKMVDLGHWFEESYKVPNGESVNNANEKLPDAKSDQKETKKQEVENNDSGDDYTQIDEDSYDENDY
jgi:endogenous inhibitor of DNA gyrase (YacG/DUF329 family)